MARVLWLKLSQDCGRTSTYIQKMRESSKLFSGESDKKPKHVNKQINHNTEKTGLCSREDGTCPRDLMNRTQQPEEKAQSQMNTVYKNKQFICI